MSISYGNFHQQVSHIFQSAIDLVNSSKSETADEICSKLQYGLNNLSSGKPLRIVLLGEFSAGKSSIISALTGEEIYVDADVATSDTSEFPWNGIILVDTPGVQAEADETNHDQIARSATIEADLILFVATNELFNQRLADHLIYVVSDEGLNLNRKTAIIINKIDRESNPLDTLLKAIFENFDCLEEIPIYFCSASKYMESKSEEGELKDRFEKQSLFNDLINGVDKFIDDSGKNGQFVTSISLIEDCMNNFEISLAESEDEKSIIEFIRKKRIVVNRLQQSINEIKRIHKQRVYSTILSEANERVDQLTENWIREDVENLYKSGLKSANAEVESIHESQVHEFISAINESNEEMQSIDNSELEKVNLDSLKRKKRKSKSTFDENENDSDVTAKIFREIGKPLHELLDKAVSNKEGIRYVYYNGMKKLFDTKFKPHGVTKFVDKFSNIGTKFSKSMPFLAIPLNIFWNIREIKRNEKKEREFTKIKMALREAFIAHARIEQEALEEAANETSKSVVQKCLEQLAIQEKQIFDSFDSNEKSKDEIASIRNACEKLRSEIYSGKN